MNEKYWDDFYKERRINEPSDFAQFVKSYLRSGVIELGSGNNRDVSYFEENTISAIGVDRIYGQSVEDYIQENKSIEYVYTRFFWHAISRKLQLDILKWVKNYIFIEARTTEDRDTEKTFKKHRRNYVNVPRLVKDLKNNGFTIEYLKEGRGMAKFENEDPFVVRIIAHK